MFNRLCYFMHFNSEAFTLLLKLIDYEMNGIFNILELQEPKRILFLHPGDEV